MRGLIVICLFTTVLAAPQGYSYSEQHNDFSIVLPNLSTNSQLDSTTKTFEDSGFLQQAATAGYLQQKLLSEPSSAPHNTQQFSSVPSLQQHQHQQAPLRTNLGGQHQQLIGYQQHIQQYPTSGTVTKDIYVHVAPDDGRDQQYQQPALPALPPRKHYRIVFIKAPSQNINNAALRLQQAPTEEKTIIYVLTKKADPLDLRAAIQEIQPKQPSKPEVYFIKYKTQEEAKHAQRTIQAQYEKLGGTSQVTDEGTAPVASVVGSLENNQQEPTLEFSRGSSHSSNSLATSAPKTNFTSKGVATSVSKYLPPAAKV